MICWAVGGSAGVGPVGGGKALDVVSRRALGVVARAGTREALVKDWTLELQGLRSQSVSQSVKTGLWSCRA